VDSPFKRHFAFGGASGQSRHRRRILGETHGRLAGRIDVSVDEVAGMHEERDLGLECDAIDDALHAVVALATAAVHVAEDDER
jgi:hypothetical protein